MQRSKIKVLFIAGFERSGSTIINRVLGQIHGFIAWGELRDIWEHGKIENRTCTCGASFNNCKAWSQILDEEFENTLGITAHQMLQLKKETREAVLLKSLSPFGKFVVSNAPIKYLQGLENLYRAIQTTTNSRVIVDSTKASWYGYILGQLPSIDLHTLHIVRDPRGVCYSLQKRKARGEPECQWYNPLHASLTWNIKNLGIERLLNLGSKRYLRMRYEDFMMFPEASVKSMLNLVDEPQAKLPFVNPSTVQMGLDHIITGSPSSRSDTGEVQLRADDKWKQKLTSLDKSVITHITLPLLKKYGYFYNA